MKKKILKKSRTNLKVTLATGVDVNRTDEEGVSSLFVSAQNGHSDIVKLLLEKGADVNRADEEGVSPLFISAQNGHFDTVKLLLENGADPNQANVDASTPISMAAADGHIDIVKALLDAGADRNVTDKWGDTPELEARRPGPQPRPAPESVTRMGSRPRGGLARQRRWHAMLTGATATAEAQICC